MIRLLSIATDDEFIDRRRVGLTHPVVFMSAGDGATMVVDRKEVRLGVLAYSVTRWKIWPALMALGQRGAPCCDALCSASCPSPNKDAGFGH